MNGHTKNEDDVFNRKLDLSDRDIRQREIVPPEKLAACHAVVIGVGAIGRQVAVQLAAVGVGSLELIDHDTVGVENLATQAFWPVDLGRPKVEATAELCQHINPMLDVIIRPQRFRRSMARQITRSPAAIFCCVDSITTRGLIWESLRQQAGFFADGRMSAEVIRVLASDLLPNDAYYPTTLFTEAEAYAGACTAKSTVYTATIAAGLMVNQFTRWLRRLPVDRDLMFNLLSAELIAG
jgi:molybdopterin/thiamine biosynthesis adenylyltransferase